MKKIALKRIILEISAFDPPSILHETVRRLPSDNRELREEGISPMPAPGKFRYFVDLPAAVASRGIIVPLAYARGSENAPVFMRFSEPRP
jgi:hypothetical protein